ncbi:MAG: hypothetical protein FD169_1314 [Bacillota bacterium]|nr:MAG: hypothetical protein FD169_1314 [Bacillota bacterium]
MHYMSKEAGGVYIIHVAFSNKIAVTLLMLAAVTLGLLGCNNPAPKFTVKLEVEGRGTVTVDPIETEYIKGTKVNFTVQPTLGYRFERWDGSVAGNSTTTSAVVSEPLTIRAIFAKTTPVVPDEALHNPMLFAKSYLMAQMEAIVQERSELIEPYFNADCPVSAYTHAYETLRIKYLIVHFTSGAGGMSWYSPDIEVSLLHEDSEAVQVRGLYSGLVLLIGTNEKPDYYNDHEPHDLTLRKSPDGSWYIERDDYAMDILIRTFGGRVKLEEFDIIFAEQKEQWKKGK